jgi:virginiamycin B lyase
MRSQGAGVGVRWAVLLGALGLARAGNLPAQFVLFPVSDPVSEPGGICAGPDGNVWFTVGNQVGRITPAGVVTRFDLPTANAGPGDIVAGPDGNLWFLEQTAGRLGRVGPAGAVTELPVPGAGVGRSLIVGPDGALWFGSIWRVSLSGAFTQYPVSPASPNWLASGSDGNLWFVEEFQRHVGRMTLSGAVTLFPRPSNGIGWRCAPGPDGNVWYTLLGRTFGRVTPSGVITEFPFSGDRGHTATSIAAGPDGNLWMPVDESFICVPSPCTPPPERDGVLRVSTDGAQTRFELTADFQISEESKITAGPDGALWFTARRGLVRFFPAQLAALESAKTIPATGLLGRLTLISLLALAGFALLRR